MQVIHYLKKHALGSAEAQSMVQNSASHTDGDL